MSTSAAIEHLLEDDTLAVITFHSNEARFAVPLQQVLYIEKDVARHSELGKLNEFDHEVITFQNQTVPLFDFNRLVGARGHREHVMELVTKLDEEEARYCAMTEDQIATSHSRFEYWLTNNSQNNPQLEDVYAELKAHHQELISALTQSDKPEQRDKAIQRFTAHLSAAKELAHNSIRPIILFLEHGAGKISALRLDQIQDIVNYQRQDFNSEDATEGILKQDKGLLKVEGFLRNGDQAPTILLNCQLLADATAQESA